jgi:hypothetical protein
METKNLLTIVFALSGSVSVHATTLKVKTAATGTGSCNSWANACTLAAAVSAAANGDQIWVKSGTYTGPLTLPNGVKIIGGFAGTETLASQSNPATNVTILSAPSNERAVYSTDSAASTVLRGFTIKNGIDVPDDEGGGGALAENSGAVFVSCIFENNTAKYFGGAVMIKGSGSPSFVNCIFRNNGTGSGENTTPLGGGAVYLHSGTPSFTNCLFYDNVGGSGGAIMASEGVATMINCTLASNDAKRGDGGGIYDEKGRVRLRNTIVWDNTVQTGYNAPQFLNDGSMYPASVRYCDVQGGFAGTGNLSSDPSFVNAGAFDYTLNQLSPCVNTGSNSMLPADVGDLDWDGNTTESLPKDLAGNPRKIDFTVDMGAHETNNIIE